MSLTTARIEPRLPAGNLDRARAWYHDKLRLDPVEQRPGGLHYATSGGSFGLFLSAGRSDASFTQLSVEVDHLEAEMAAMRSRGVVFLDYAEPLDTVDGLASIDGNYPSRGTGELAAWCRDSENNLIGMSQPLPARRTHLLGTSLLLGTVHADRLYRFYEHVLDLTRDANGWLRVGSLDVKIDPRDDVSPTNPEPGRVVLSVDAVEEAGIIGRLDGLGAPCIVRGDIRPNGIFSTFQDPDGNLIQVLQLTDAYRASISR